jgi:two-component system, chemotaxis family, response regulator Rcp1
MLSPLQRFAMCHITGTKTVEECIILHVEDDDATAYLFRAALTDAHLNPQVMRVADSDEASACLSRTGAYQSAPKPDLILLDINLPGRSGLDLLAEMRLSAHVRHLPVIIFSTSALLRDRELAVKLGAYYVPKPDDFDSFVAAAASICSRLPIAA